MKKYLTHSVNKALKERKEYYLYDVPVYILKSLPEHININNIINDLTNMIPFEFLDGLEGIYVGEFEELQDRRIQAMLKDGAIYLSSFKDHPEVTETIIVNDIIHELAHLLEERAHADVYGDDIIEKEYISKKKKLVELLRANGISFYGMGDLFFSEDRINDLDAFLFNELGYDNLSILTTGLFTSPYSVTSIREYFANGFEEFINGDESYLKEISPALYNKLDSMLEIE